ncbi:MAG: glycogen debranching protein GlgX [Geodermatophilaceae bacterium]
MDAAGRGGHRDLGATWDGTAGNISVWAPAADTVEVCLFDDAGQETRTALPTLTEQVWHGRLPGIHPGQRYGFRMHGAGCNPAKLLQDPYARAIEGVFRPHEAVLGAGRHDSRDTAPYVPRSVIVDEAFDWEGDRPPAVPWTDTVLYETHVRGFTLCHPGVPAELRGTYAGLAQPPVLDHLTSLGITSVELLPVHHFVSEPRLLRRGLRNFWGYNTLGFLAPHAGYSASGALGQQVTEFKAMVKALHAAGLEVILDVVYNHTAEGDHTGPTLSLRGIDDAAYYRLDPADPGRYADVTGCGNTLDASRAPGLRLVMDSLRYWVEHMHVDGFRFDLAPALARSSGGAVDMHGAFLSALGQDPILRRVKLIAEPWDVGAGGHHVGRFPSPWRDWNDRYRDCVRDFWRGRSDGVQELASRLTGSSDLYREPTASVNFVASHDGFTLRDLVSYNDKHNEDNGEDNRDGDGNNRSWNCGIEGPGTPDVEELRRRQSRNFLTTLVLSAGVPMLLAGDERRRTQLGNNNAYCQDNGLSYVDWGDSTEQQDLRAWTAALLRVRRTSAVLAQPKFAGPQDISWYGADGTQMSERQWQETERQTVGVHLGNRPSYLLWLHAGDAPTSVTLPPRAEVGRYDVLLDTARERPDPGVRGLPPGSSLALLARSAVLLQCHDHYSAGRPRRRREQGRV